MVDIIPKMEIAFGATRVRVEFDVGGRVYITPVENLEITAFGMVDMPIQDNEDDNVLRFGVETVFSF